MDKDLRAQLVHNLVTDELMDSTDKLITIALDFPKNNPNAMSQEIVDLIMDVLYSLTHRSFSPLPSNLRGRLTNLSSIVKTKLSLRDEVLRGYSRGVGSAFTIEVSGGYSFFSAEFLGLCQIHSY